MRYVAQYHKPKSKISAAYIVAGIHELESVSQLPDGSFRDGGLLPQMLAGGKTLQLGSRESGERRVLDRVRDICADTHLPAVAPDCRNLLSMRKHRAAARS